MTMLEINEKLADAKFRMEHYQRLCEERNELVLKLDEAHRVYAVSYTHLDVYKRQDQMRRLQIIVILEGK